MVRSSWNAMFLMGDVLRQSLGTLLDNAGYAPQEMTWYRVQHPDLQLRRYFSNSAATNPVLIVPAPIKRPYIFDLLPQVSVIRRLADAGFAVYLHEWPEEQAADWNLETSIALLLAAIEKLSRDHQRAPVVIGHSLGGTLAAIAAALVRRRVGKLVLVQAPLAFGQCTGALRPIAIDAQFEVLSRRIAGSLLDCASVAAAPEEFFVGRYCDAWASLSDLEALALHGRVIRWTLDEFAPSRQLLQDVIELLYREDRFARNDLHLLDRTARCDALAELPVAAIVDHTSRVVPPSSTLQQLSSPRVFVYEPEIGVALQHVGALVGRRAHREIWPHVIEWLRQGGDHKT
ncbi:alpha/beta fold hydrolase [Bradyrhizobium vignae]|uniref:Poly(3-hydroxybutyrate) synthase subunit n=1 Tax=Bradyrhizobium vignae TaxID=1549949 RepID=A0A2U3PVA2_9BRAD|nr:alpha/beta fold hydrolase [Bradyrhizobium vignae]SPP93082.1 Poly(3-hydroxybutyrate) synthase subunit [Bradyrhizobium vignae]